MTTRGEQTKERILTAALHLYLEEGAHNTTFQMIADEVALTQGALYKHFRNRDELVAASIRHASSLGREFLFHKHPEGASAHDQFRYHVKRNIEWVTSERKSSVALMAMHYFAACMKEVRKVHEEVNEARIERFTHYIASGVREGTWTCSDPRLAAEAVHSYLMGEMIKAFIWPKETAVSTRVDRVWKVSVDLIETAS